MLLVAEHPVGMRIMLHTSSTSGGLYTTVKLSPPTRSTRACCQASSLGVLASISLIVGGGSGEAEGVLGYQN